MQAVSSGSGRLTRDSRSRCAQCRLWTGIRVRRLDNAAPACNGLRRRLGWFLPGLLQVTCPELHRCTYLRVGRYTSKCEEERKEAPCQASSCRRVPALYRVPRCCPKEESAATACRSIESIEFINCIDYSASRTGHFRRYCPGSHLALAKPVLSDTGRTAHRQPS